MLYTDKEYIINKIVSGCTICSFEDQPVLVYDPSPHNKILAHDISIKEYRRAELLEVPKDEDILVQMKLRGMWSHALQKELDSLPKSIENLKIELYNAFFQFKRRDQIKKSIDGLRFREVELLSQRDKFKHVTCEGFALACKNKHLICSGAKHSDGTAFFTDYNACSQGSLDNFIQDYFANKIDDETIRELSKDEPWRGIWSAGKQEGAIFGIPSSLLSHEQRMLIIWSRIYDSVYESPDCPPDEVLEDNDYFND